jgi:hypothetical protein
MQAARKKISQRANASVTKLKSIAAQNHISRFAGERCKKKLCGENFLKNPSCSLANPAPSWLKVHHNTRKSPLPVAAAGPRIPQAESIHRQIDERRC